MQTNIPSVLVVDDDIAVCRIVGRMLSDEQYQVETSQSVGDAVAVIDQKPFDVFVLDYKLTDGTGLDVAERLRSKGNQAPIILITGYDSSGITARTESLRIFEIIEKPFSRDAICGAVKKSIGIGLIAEQRDAQSVSPSSPEPAATKPPATKPGATKTRLPKVAVIGAIIFLLFLISLTIYLLTHGH
jgi:DNA-binding NtrC family response regulator